jgi:predicted XRE-type DNA-binding protein
MAKRRSHEDLAKVLRPVDQVPIEELPTDRPWRQEILEWLKRNEMTQTTLATWVGVSQSVISNMLNEKNQSFRARSEFVRKVGEATGIGLPITARAEVAMKRIVESGNEEASSAAALQIEALAEHVTTRHRSGGHR